MKNNRNANRFIMLAGIYVVVFAIIIAQLVNLQLGKGKEYDEQSQRRLLRNSTVQAPRGNIVDRNNIPLATNRMGYTVLASKANLKSDQLNEMIYKLIQIFEKNGDYQVNTLSKYITFDIKPTGETQIGFGDYIKKSDIAISKWKKEVILDLEELNYTNTAEDVFKYLLNTKFKISSGYPQSEAYKILAIRYEMYANGYTSVNPVFLCRDASVNTVAEIEERHSEFPGVVTEVVPVRKYVDAVPLSHIIGYLGKISQDEIDAKRNEGRSYDINDLIGKSGIENSEETLLRGTNGAKQIEVDTNGRLTSVIGGNEAFAGKDIVLTIDAKLQKVAFDSLEKTINTIKGQADGKTNYGDAFAGAAIAMDVNNGEVLAMVSYPAYDPTVFLAGADDYEAQKKKVSYLLDNKNIPMFNRALKGIYAPGSIFKPITAIAALEEGVITAEQTIYDSGEYTIDGRTFYCLEKRLGLGAHGNIALTRALATSCNVYFHDVGVRTGIDKISKWTKMFGLGDYTGIDIPGESKGLLGDKIFKTTVKKENWYPADTAQTAIGQLYNAFTPLQIVNYVSTIANGGQKFTPHVIKQILNSDGTLFQETKSQATTIELKSETLRAVREGMVAVTNATDGTAVNMFSGFDFTVAGKTGTPETGFEAGKQSSNGLFICYAPAEAPRIAIMVVIEHGVWGANVAPVASDILHEYFAQNKIILEDKPAEADFPVLTK